jgi:hypothetical protein
MKHPRYKTLSPEEIKDAMQMVWNNGYDMPTQEDNGDTQRRSHWESYKKIQKWLLEEVDSD